MYPLTFCLDGEWSFYYIPQKFSPERDPLPPPAVFTGRMVTPGYWDDHLELFDEEDFFGLTARFNPDYRKPHFPMGRSLTPHASSCFLIGTGFYFKEFVFDSSLCGSRAVINIGPAMWGCSCFINGKLAGTVTGYSTSSSFDITSLLVSGVNSIVIAVDNVRDDGGAYCRVDGTHAGIPFGTRPGQHRGLAAQGYQSERAGIGGGVSIKLTSGNSGIADWYLSYENNSIVWHLKLVNGIGKTLSCSVGASKCRTFVSSGNDVVFSTPAPEKLWSDTDPVLYDFEISLVDGTQLCDRVTFKWGAVDVKCSGVKIEVNGKPVYFRGVTEHCYFADTTNPHFDKARYLRELGVLKRAGVNFIRCHTWCPPEPFYDACDELGIYVQTEFPSVYTFEEVRDILRMIRRHTCAVIVCEGNEKYIDDDGIERLREVCRIAKEMIPGVLFNPQEAIRGVEYGFLPEQNTVKEPFEYDKERFDKIAEFSDLYGSLGGGYFSYIHDEFPGVEQVEEMHTIYRKPCLSHETGILGGYLDFSLEERYRNTYIGTSLFEAARENMLKHGVYQNARKYYEYNSLFISSIRKQLMENIRSCPSIAGYDYLGGIDTHWHLIGYPCGIFNEFYEEKFGESIADVAVYNGESVLFTGQGKHRNFNWGTAFVNSIGISYYGCEERGNATLAWRLVCGEKTLVSGREEFSVPAPGSVVELCKINVDLPPCSEACCATLYAEFETAGTKIGNHWKYWLFPIPEETVCGNIRILGELSCDDVKFMANGGCVLLTGNFPAKSMPERFAPHTSGRSIGHSGVLINPHPVTDGFPHSGFADWQFYPLMTNSLSLISDETTPEYAPVVELIPSFKLIKHKSFLSEFRVGSGRLIICGLRLDIDDPAAKWLRFLIVRYLGSGTFVPAPEWECDALTASLSQQQKTVLTGKKIDEGGRPVDQ